MNEAQLSLLAQEIYHGLHNPLRPGELERAYELGMLRPSQLEDGAYYLGDCRNATVACWSAEHQTFAYVRNKFGSSFTEEIEHPANDDGYDLFIPVAKVYPTILQVIEVDFYRHKTERKNAKP